MGNGESCNGLGGGSGCWQWDRGKRQRLLFGPGRGGTTRRLVEEALLALRG
jgi:hypothetical protein